MLLVRRSSSSGEASRQGSCFSTGVKYLVIITRKKENFAREYDVPAGFERFVSDVIRIEAFNGSEPVLKATLVHASPSPAQDKKTKAK